MTTETGVPDPGAAEAHPVTDLDDVVHQRVRLGILTIAHEARRVEFGYLREQLQLTAGNLSKHLSVLEAAGLIEVEKGPCARSPGPPSGEVSACASVSMISCGNCRRRRSTFTAPTGA